MAAASLADPQTLNMYAYVGNDPVNRVDPDGQFWGALFRFIAGLFTSLKPNVINGSFAYKNQPPISVSFTPNFQNIGVGYGGIGFGIRSGGRWITNMLFQQPRLSTCQRFANRVRELANAANSWKELFDNMARTFMSQTDGHPADSSLWEMWHAQGGIITGEALQFLPNDGIRAKYIGVTPDFPAGQPGQIRHFVAALISASQPFGTTSAMMRETAPTAWGSLPARAMDPDSVADRALNGLGSYIFDRVFYAPAFNRMPRLPRSMSYIREHLANEIRRDLCE